MYTDTGAVVPVVVVRPPQDDSPSPGPSQVPTGQTRQTGNTQAPPPSAPPSPRRNGGGSSGNQNNGGSNQRRAPKPPSPARFATGKSSGSLPGAKNSEGAHIKMPNPGDVDKLQAALLRNLTMVVKKLNIPCSVTLYLGNTTISCTGEHLLSSSGFAVQVAPNVKYTVFISGLYRLYDDPIIEHGNQCSLTHSSTANASQLAPMWTLYSHLSAARPSTPLLPHHHHHLSHSSWRSTRPQVQPS